MYAGICRSESTAGKHSPGLRSGLATAGIRGGFVARRDCTLPASVFEHGGYRLARPSTFSPHLEAIIVNTGGGVVGGDRIGFSFAASESSDVVLSTQAAERIYRTTGAPSLIDITLTLDEAARIDWLPQQTILYAGSKLHRRIDVAFASTSRLLMVEVLTFGRPASREASLPVEIVDNWRVRRDGRLVFAEAMRFAGDMAELLARPAVGDGARTTALVLYAAPDAEAAVALAREAIADTGCPHGVSAWNGILTARMMATSPSRLIAAATALARALCQRQVPRAWSV